MGGSYIDIRGQFFRLVTCTGAPRRTEKARIWPDKLVLQRPPKRGWPPGTPRCAHIAPPLWFT
eukprot:2306496-Prymnesium_polylepis.1